MKISRLCERRKLVWLEVSLNRTLMGRLTFLQLNRKTLPWPDGCCFFSEETIC